MACAYGVPMDIIRKTLREFKGVEHRIEFVAEKNGVAIIMIQRERIRTLQSGEFRP